MTQLKPPIAALVFDLDDTLYPELAYVRSGFQAVAAHLAGPSDDPQPIFEQLFHTFQHGPRDRVFNHILKQLDRPDDPDTIAALVQLYRTHNPTLQLAPEIKDLLCRLRARYQLGLITDGYLPAQKLKIQALNLEPLFHYIICTEDLGRAHWKPPASTITPPR